MPVAACFPLASDARSIFEAAAFDPPHLLLESARSHSVTGRYSLIVGEPEKILTASGRRVRIREETREKIMTADPFRAVEDLLRADAAVRVPGLPPFVGGAVGLVGFEAARLLESLPARTRDDLRLPDLAFLFCDEAIVLDHLKQKLWIIALAKKGRNPARCYGEAVARIDRLIERIRPPTKTGWTAGRSASDACLPSPSRGGLISTHSRASFESMVRRAKEFVARGEIYQANLSQRFSAPLTGRPWDLYRRLTQINPSPFAAYADFGNFQIASASPERLLRVRGDRIDTRPIAGTRPKGRTAVETARLRRDLILNEKERAEHLMLVDLERNDLGRICRYDTVEVDDLMALEEYSHVIHIVSNVRGRLRPGVGFRELMKATFPGGTISGCPKIRCLEIIDRLEPVRRHFYTGSLGYLSATGDMDLNLLIRTAIVREGRVHVQAGAGIVADSDPSREYDETVQKARALLEAIGAGTPEHRAAPVLPVMGQV